MTKHQQILRKTAKFLYCVAKGAPATLEDFKTFSDLCWLCVPMNQRMDRKEINEIESHPWESPPSPANIRFYRIYPNFWTRFVWRIMADEPNGKVNGNGEAEAVECPTSPSGCHCSCYYEMELECCYCQQTRFREKLRQFDNLASVRAASTGTGWISVIDGLPHFGTYVIVVIDGVVQHCAAKLLMNSEWEWGDSEADSAPFNAVTHWQPFPAMNRIWPLGSGSV